MRERMVHRTYNWSRSVERQAKRGRAAGKKLQVERGREDCPSPWVVSVLLDYKGLRTVRGS